MIRIFKICKLFLTQALSTPIKRKSPPSTSHNTDFFSGNGSTQQQLGTSSNFTRPWTTRQGDVPPTYGPGGGMDWVSVAAEVSTCGPVRTAPACRNRWETNFKGPAMSANRSAWTTREDDVLRIHGPSRDIDWDSIAAQVSSCDPVQTAPACANHSDTNVKGLAMSDNPRAWTTHEDDVPPTYGPGGEMDWDSVAPEVSTYGQVRTATAFREGSDTNVLAMSDNPRTWTTREDDALRILGSSGGLDLDSVAAEFSTCGQVHTVTACREGSDTDVKGPAMSDNPRTWTTREDDVLRILGSVGDLNPDSVAAEVSTCGQVQTVTACREGSDTNVKGPTMTDNPRAWKTREDDALRTFGSGGGLDSDSVAAEVSTCGQVQTATAFREGSYTDIKGPAMSDNPRAWTTRQDDVLRTYKNAAVGDVDWDSVAAKLSTYGPVRTVSGCRNRWETHVKEPAMICHPRHWTTRQDHVLLIHGSGGVMDWDAVAAEVSTCGPVRTVTACKNRRWNHANGTARLMPDASLGRHWDHREDEVLEFSGGPGADWELIAAQLNSLDCGPLRTANACKARFSRLRERSLSPAIPELIDDSDDTSDRFPTLIAHDVGNRQTAEIKKHTLPTSPNHVNRRATTPLLIDAALLEKAASDLGSDLSGTPKWVSVCLGSRYKEISKHRLRADLLEQAINDVVSAQQGMSKAMLYFCTTIRSAYLSEAEFKAERSVDAMERVRKRELEIEAGKDKWLCVAARYSDLAWESRAG